MQNEAKFDWRLALLPVKDGKNIKASSLGGYDWVDPEGREGGRRRVQVHRVHVRTRAS